MSLDYSVSKVHFKKQYHFIPAFALYNELTILK